MYTYSVSGYDVNNKVSILIISTLEPYNIKRNVFCRNFLLVLYVRYVKFYKPNRVAVSPNRKNHFVVTYVLKEMNNVTLAFWEQKTMMPVVIKIVNCVEIKVLFAVIKIRLAVKTVNLCQQV